MIYGVGPSGRNLHDQAAEYDAQSHRKQPSKLHGVIPRLKKNFSLLNLQDTIRSPVPNQESRRGPVDERGGVTCAVKSPFGLKTRLELAFANRLTRVRL
jgi:hypothetical protein